MHAATLHLMHRARRSPSAVLWLCVALLVWQAAVPWLAATAASTRAQFTAEVCSVYGVRTVALTDAADVAVQASPDPSSGGWSHGGPADPLLPAAHAGADHCTLSGLMAAAVVPVLLFFQWGAVASAAPQPAAQRALALRDATRHWVASLKQGPPARA